MDADDAYAVALMRRHGVTERTVETLAGDQPRVPALRRRRRRRRGSSPTATSSSRAGGAGACASGRGTARPTPCSPATACCWPATTCSRRSPRTRSRTCRSAPRTRSRSPPAPDRPRTLITYLASLRATAADDRGELILPGHGDPFTGAARPGRASAPGCPSGARRRSSRALDRPRTAADVGRDLWRHVPVTQAYLVLSEVLGHLDLLEARGAVAAEERDGVVVYARASWPRGGELPVVLPERCAGTGSRRSGTRAGRSPRTGSTTGPSCCAGPASRAARGSSPATGSSTTRRSGAACSRWSRRSSAPEPRDHPRWPWTIAVEPLLVVPVLDAAPPVEAIGVAARSMSQQSHIRLRPEHYERAVAALASVAPPSPCAGARGRRTVNVVRPGRESSRTSPSWRSRTIRRVVSSPRPVPGADRPSW